MSFSHTWVTMGSSRCSMYCSACDRALRAVLTASVLTMMTGRPWESTPSWNSRPRNSSGSKASGMLLCCEKSCAGLLAAACCGPSCRSSSAPAYPQRVSSARIVGMHAFSKAAMACNDSCVCCRSSAGVAQGMQSLAASSASFTKQS